MLRYIIFAPLVGAVINWLIGRRLRSEAFIGTVACTAVGISTVIAFMLAFGRDGAISGEEPRVILDHLWTWIEVGGFRADFGLGMDRLSAVYVCFVTFVGLLIHVFATGYMHGDPGFYRFFAYLNLFMFMMLTLVLADNLLLMFVGWEGVGLCSYLLIGYYFDRREAGDAAKKAFVANRVGDWGVVLGIMLVFFLTAAAGNGSISFFDKPDLGVTSALSTIATMPTESFTFGAIFAGGLTSAALLLFIGATGKSAQIPLFVWLPDAMAGPTPVSALIHAATMVTAGVYLIVRCSALYVHAPTAMFIIAVVGAATALFAATIGLAQNDIKKVLAYSTVSQLGYMMLACGVGAFVAAIFHVMTHAFFKALLFLGSGSVIHGMHHEQDMRRMGGLKKFMPITFATMVTGWLAISGIPIFAGFWSKDEILYKTFSTGANDFGLVLWVVGLITAVLTAAYMTRMMVMTFWGGERFREAHAGGQADEAHAQAFADKKVSAHDAHTPSVGDRPHHSTSHEVTGHDPAAAVVTAAHHDDDDDTHEHHGLAPGQVPHESPLVMTLPLIILAVLSVFGGLLGAPYALSGGLIDNPFHHVLEPVVAHEPNFVSAPAHGTADDHGVTTGKGAPVTSAGAAPAAGGHAATATTAAHSPEEIRTERILAGVSILLALVGIGAGWVIFNRRPLLRLPRVLENKWYVDEAYNAAIITPLKVGSREGLWRFFDLGVIDGIVNGIGRAMSQIGAAVRYLQPGFVRSYAAIILFGALAVIGYFAYSAYQVLPFAR